MEPQQASNSPSPQCKEFIIQPKSSPFYFTCCVIIIFFFTRYIFDAVWGYDWILFENKKTNTNSRNERHFKQYDDNSGHLHVYAYSHSHTSLLASFMNMSSSMFLRDWTELFYIQPKMIKAIHKFDMYSN